uniref:Uncharacterized protein n=1 Tax=Micrurus carvalhoi TaxID=3147026 RepID=A0A2H6N0T0_9SAUR
MLKCEQGLPASRSAPLMKCFSPLTTLRWELQLPEFSGHIKVTKITKHFFKKFPNSDQNPISPPIIVSNTDSHRLTVTIESQISVAKQGSCLVSFAPFCCHSC